MAPVPSPRSQLYDAASPETLRVTLNGAWPAVAEAVTVTAGAAACAPGARTTARQHSSTSLRTSQMMPGPPVGRRVSDRRDSILGQVSTLAVMGAGPKGIAIAAKARALAAAGLCPPRVVLVDRGAVAGNWSGKQGYTSGLLPLGTPPEKDVGFPYPDSWGDASDAVTAEMARFGWQRHLIERGVYADWVDRGRLRPTHRQWSAYLREVAEKAEAEIVGGELVGLDVDDEQWQLTLDAGETIIADGVVFTGAGTSITVPGQPEQHARVFDGRSYWLRGRTAKGDVTQSACVIGSGETAAS